MIIEGNLEKYGIEEHTIIASHYEKIINSAQFMIGTKIQINANDIR